MFQSKECSDIVEEIKEKYYEYLEMMENPDSFVIGVMAKEILKLNNYINFLQKRIDHVS